MTQEPHPCSVLFGIWFRASMGLKTHQRTREERSFLCDTVHLKGPLGNIPHEFGPYTVLRDKMKSHVNRIDCGAILWWPLWKKYGQIERENCIPWPLTSQRLPVQEISIGNTKRMKNLTSLCNELLNVYTTDGYKWNVQFLKNKNMRLFSFCKY